MSDQWRRVQLANHLPSDIDAPFIRPTRRKLRGQGADLAADESYAVAMKLSAQIQLGRLISVPGAEYDAGAEPGHLDGLVQSLWITR